MSRPSWDKVVNIARQFLLFSVAGGFAAIGHYGTLIILTESAGVPPVPASLAGFLVGAMIGYVLNYRFTFRSTKQHGDALSKFLVVAMVGFVLNGVVMAALTGWVRMHYLAAQLAATAAVLLWTFSSNRYWTFRVSRMR